MNWMKNSEVKFNFGVAEDVELADFDPCCLVAGCRLQFELWSL